MAYTLLGYPYYPLIYPTHRYAAHDNDTTRVGVEIDVDEFGDGLMGMRAISTLTKLGLGSGCSSKGFWLGWGSSKRGLGRIFGND